MPPTTSRRSASAPPKGSEASPLKKAAIEAISCPMTRLLVVAPVVAEDEITYERAAITKWLRAKDTSPITGAVLENNLGQIDSELRAFVGELKAMGRWDEV